MTPQGREIGCRNRKVEAGTRSGLVQQMRRALHTGGKPARGKLRVDVEFAGQRPAQRDSRACRTLREIDPAPEPQEPGKLRPVIGREISVELQFERVDIERIAGRLRDEAEPGRAGPPVDGKLGNGPPARGLVRTVDDQTGAEIERRKTSDARANGFPDGWAQLRGEGREPSEPARF